MLLQHFGCSIPHVSLCHDNNVPSTKHNNSKINGWISTVQGLVHYLSSSGHTTCVKNDEMPSISWTTTSTVRRLCWISFRALILSWADICVFSDSPSPSNSRRSFATKLYMCPWRNRGATTKVRSATPTRLLDTLWVAPIEYNPLHSWCSSFLYLQ